MAVAGRTPFWELGRRPMGQGYAMNPAELELFPPQAHIPLSGNINLKNAISGSFFSML